MSPSLFSSAMMTTAPTTGPTNVPMPPTRVIRMTRPDMAQCTSVSVAKPSTSVLVAPARPASAADKHEGQQLVAVDVVAQRNGARLVFLDRLQHLAERRMHDAHDEREAGDADRQHDVVQRQVVGQIDQAEQLAARHALQPSSPPVNGACRQTKYTICASASVIIAK